MTTHRSSRLKRPTLLAVQCAAILVASILLALAVLGFVPGVTTNLDTIEWAGPDSSAKLFGVFQISLLHNIFHLIIGIAGLVLARTYRRARAYLLGGGLVFAGLWLHGVLTEHHRPANFLPVNSADTWLHFGLGLTMIIFAVTLAGARVPTGAGGEVLLPPED
jgi:uncharacterized membrane protein YuzA (DUF378 family)